MDRFKRAIDAYRRVRDAALPASPNSDRDNRRAAQPHPAAAGESSATFEKVGGPEQATPRIQGGSGRRAAPGGQSRSDGDLADESAEASAGTKRAARLLIAMGPEHASKVLAELGQSEVEAIVREIMRTPAVRRSEAEELVAEIGEAVERRRLRGGPEVAREMLAAAFGDEVGERFFYRTVPFAAQHHFAFINDLERHQLRALLRDESPAAIALIAAHIDRAKAAALLADLPSEVRDDAVRRIARMGKLSREVVVRVEEAVREKIRTQGRVVTQGVEGASTLAAILRHMAPSAETALLRELDLVDGELGRSVRDELYTTDILFAISDRDLSDLMREFSDSEIAMFLKGKEERLRVRVLGSVSDRRRITISDEYAHLGPQHLGDVDEITRELLQRIRELAEAGEILVPREGERYI